MIKLVKVELTKTLGITGDFDVSVPEVEVFGHYSTNVALRQAAIADKTPMELARIYAEKIQGSESKLFKKVEVVAPGFINLWLSDEFLAKQLSKVAEGNYLMPLSDIGQTIVIDQCGTNIAKPMHVGHLRSTVIGAALSNIYESLGYKVIRWNYLGDWGTQFGKLIAAYKLWGDKKEVEKAPIETLLALYVRFHDELKTNPDLDKQGQEEFRKLEEGDGENRKLWEWFKDESMLAFDKIYKRLGVKFDHNIGEEFYVEEMRPVVNELKEKGIATPSEGGIIVHLEKFDLPVALIQKSDGASLYITRDIASIRHRISKYKPEKLLYVVANEQALHFQQLFAIAKMLGVTTEMEHIKFGMVLGEDGKKLSTREGKAVKLEEVLDEIVNKAFEIVKKNNPDMTAQRQRQTAEIVGIGALKYNDLKENRLSDIKFDWDKMLDIHGDSAPYLQYTTVRLNSILKKFYEQNPKEAESDLNPQNIKELVLNSEKALMKKVIDYRDIVELCAQTNLTSHLAKYLFELAKLANHYYETTRILEDDNRLRRYGRLLLVSIVVGTLTAGLKLLGIAVPNRI